MVYYKVSFKVNRRNEYVYPKQIEGVVWKRVTYHPEKNIMIGETDKKIKADGKNVVELKATEAKRKIAAFSATSDLPAT